MGTAPVKRNSVIWAAVMVAVLSACQEREVILRGEREHVRSTLAYGGPDPDAEVANRAVAIRLPGQVNHANWTHRNGSPAHRITHPALNHPLNPIWKASIGKGETRRHRITAEPVLSNGRIFTLDAFATVAAHSTAGKPLWSVDLTPSSDRTGDASGGALTVAAGQLFVTTGFGGLFALDPATGGVRWRQTLDASMTGGVSVQGDVLYTVSRDGRAWALDARTGRIRWEQAGITPDAIVVGGASPAVTDGMVIFPYGSGDVVGMLRQNGIRMWQAGVSGGRTGVSRASITDITSDPVVDGQRVYVGNQSGRLAALDLNSGRRLWTANEGALGPVWPVGGSVFFVSDVNQLIRLDADTGTPIWAVDLPNFVHAQKRPRRWAEVVAHYGPVLAGGRLILASNDGLIRSFDPTTGALIGTAEIPGGAATAPIVARGRLYVVSTRGELYAFQ